MSSGAVYLSPGGGGCEAPEDKFPCQPCNLPRKNLAYSYTSTDGQSGSGVLTYDGSDPSNVGPYHKYDLTLVYTGLPHLYDLILMCQAGPEVLTLAIGPRAWWPAQPGNQLSGAQPEPGGSCDPVNLTFLMPWLAGSGTFITFLITE